MVKGPVGACKEAAGWLMPLWIGTLKKKERIKDFFSILRCCCPLSVSDSRFLFFSLFSRIYSLLMLREWERCLEHWICEKRKKKLFSLSRRHLLPLLQRRCSLPFFLIPKPSFSNMENVFADASIFRTKLILISKKHSQTLGRLICDVSAAAYDKMIQRPLLACYF